MHLAVFSVLDFHEKMGLTIGDPRDPDVTKDQNLRIDLIQEEFDELKLALQGFDKHSKSLSQGEQVIAVADALADLSYVIAGAAVTWGIDLGSVFEAVHESNMTKTPGNKRSDGKLMKGENYEPPNIAQALENASQDLDLGEAFGKNQMPAEMASQLLASTKADLDLLIEEIREGKDPVVSDEMQALAQAVCTPHHNAFNGTFLDRGAYIFNCSCGRQHEVSTKLGTRGGRAQEASCECMCGQAYSFGFKILDGKEHAFGEVVNLSKGH